MAELRAFQFSNFARSTLSSDLAAGATTLNIQSDQAHLFPDAASPYDEIFACILFTEDLLDVEIVYCTDRVGGSFIVERGKEFTTDRDWPAGTTIVHNYTAQLGTDISDSGARTVPAIIVLGGTTANSNGIIFGEDAETWTLRQRPNEAARAIIWIPSVKRLVMVCSSGTELQAIFVSDDEAVTWQPRETPAGSDGWYAIAFAPTLGAAGRLCCCSTDTDTNGSKIMTSDDFGDTWTYRTTPVGMDSENWRAMHWDAVNGTFITLASGLDDIYYSTDGITWVQATTSAGVNRGNHMAQQDESPFRVTYSYGGDASNEWTDDGGDNWTAVGPPNGWPGGTLDMEWGGPTGSKVFVGALTGTRGQPWSPDASSWTEGVNPLPTGWNSGSYSVMVWAEHLALFVGFNASSTPNGVIVSASGKEWTGNDLGHPGHAWVDGTIFTIRADGARNREEIVMVEQAGDTRAVASVDGYTWVNHKQDTNTFQFGIAFSPTLGTQGRFISIGDTGVIQLSDDAGVTWADQTTAPGSIDLTSILWNPILSLFVAVADDAGTDQIITSSDGITWAEQATGASFRFHDIVQDPSGNMVACGNNGVANNKEMYSSDGITWTDSDDHSPFNRSVCLAYDSSRSRFIVADLAENVWFSTDDGVSWTDLSATLPPGAALSAGTSKMIYVASEDRLLLTSNLGVLGSVDGGVTWTTNYAGTATRGLLEMSNGRILCCQTSNDRMLFSEDGGATWFVASDPDAQLGAWTFMAAGRVLESV